MLRLRCASPRLLAAADAGGGGAKRASKGWKKEKKGSGAGGGMSKGAAASNREAMRKAGKEAEKQLMRWAAPKAQMAKRSPEEMAERKAVYMEYFRQSRAERNALVKDLKLKMALQRSALRALPERFRESAEAPDMSDFPSRRWLPTFEVPETFPPEDIDKQRVHDLPKTHDAFRKDLFNVEG